MSRKICIVGAGFAGLVFTDHFSNLGYKVTTYEKSDQFGGVWQKFANKYSKVQVCEPCYRFPELFKTNDKLPSDLTPQNEILLEAQFIYNRVKDKINFNAEVTKIQKESEKYKVFIKVNNGKILEEIFDIVIVLIGTLHIPKKLEYQDEKLFSKKIVYGISNNLGDTDLKDKVVGIVGSGAFSVENARFSLLNGAKKVYFFLRHKNLVLTHFASYLVGREGLRKEKAIDILRTPYEMLGETTIPKLSGTILDKNFGIFPVSDFYFIARYLGVLEECLVPIRKFNSTGVELEDGQQLDLDIFIKCVGFDKQATDTSYKNITCYEKPEKSFFVDGTPNFIFLNEVCSSGKDFYLEGYSVDGALFGYKNFAEIYSIILKMDRKKIDRLFFLLPHFDSFSINSSNVVRFLVMSSGIEPKIKYLLLYNTLKKKYLYAKRYGFENNFIHNNKNEWRHIYDTLTKNKINHKPFKYPFVSTSWLKSMLNYCITIVIFIVYKMIFTLFKR